MITAEELKAQIQSQQPRQYTDADLQQMTDAEYQLSAAGMDFTTSDAATKNAILVGDYFQQNRNIPVTVHTIIQFVNQNNTKFAWRSPAQQKFDQLTSTDPGRGQEMLDYLKAQKSLVNTGEGLYLNAAELFQELHGRPITPESVHAAIGRIAVPTSRFDTRRRGQLHFAQGPARKLSLAAQQDDPNRKHGVFIEKFSNGPASLHHNHALDKEDTPTTPATITGAAQSEALSIRGNTHSQTVMLQKIFVTKLGTTDVDWNATLEARRRMQQEFSNKRIR